MMGGRNSKQQVRQQRWYRAVCEEGEYSYVPFRAAYHEAGHAVTYIHGLRELNIKLPPPLIRYVE